MAKALHSPLRRTREQLGLTTSELTALCGTSLGTINFAEHGTGKLSAKLLLKLTESGVDVETLQRDHKSFCALQTKELLHKATSAFNQENALQ